MQETQHTHQTTTRTTQNQDTDRTFMYKDPKIQMTHEKTKQTFIKNNGSTALERSATNVTWGFKLGL